MTQPSTTQDGTTQADIAGGRAARAPVPHVVIGGLGFPEAPRWAGGALWCVDGEHVWRAVPGEEPRIYATLPGHVLGIQFHGGQLLAAAAHLRKIYRVDAHGRHVVYADLTDIFDRPINEFYVLEDGTTWVGHMGYDPRQGEERKAARMARIGPDGGIALTGPALLFANGMDLSPDGRSLIVAESAAQRIVELPVLPDGTLGEAHVFADLAPLDLAPDGLCVLPDGSVWYAAKNTLRRVSKGGVELDRVELPYAFATSCVAGGPDGRSLYFTALEQRPAPGVELPRTGVLGKVQLESGR